MKTTWTSLTVPLAAAAVLAFAGSAMADNATKAGDATKAPIQLTHEQMDKIVAGAVVDTQGQNLELHAPGNNINSCNSGQCYWYNTSAGKPIGKPVNF